MTAGDEAIARSQIRHLQAVYNTSGDRGKIGELVAVFAPDGVLDIETEAFAGPEAIADFLTKVATGGSGSDLSGSRHHLTTSRIEFTEGGQAQGWTYFFVMRRGIVLQEGTYVDRYRKVDGQWRIAHRRVKLVYDQAA